MKRIMVGMIVVVALAVAPVAYAASATDAVPQSSVSAPATSVPKPILTAAPQKKLVALLVTHGLDVALHQSITAALGMSKVNEVLTLRQLTANTHPNLHTYI